MCPSARHLLDSHNSRRYYLAKEHTERLSLSHAVYGTMAVVYTEWLHVGHTNNSCLAVVFFVVALLDVLLFAIQSSSTLVWDLRYRVFGETRQQTCYPNRSPTFA